MKHYHLLFNLGFTRCWLLDLILKDLKLKPLILNSDSKLHNFERGKQDLLHSQ